MTHSSLTKSLAAAAIPVLATLPATAQENIRGATTPTTSLGYDHRDQFAHLETVSASQPGQERLPTSSRRLPRRGV
jgi:hypothetical protein